MDKRKNSQVLVKVLCVITAFVFWLYVTAIENPISTMTLDNVTVDVINQDDLAKSKLALLPDQDFTVNLTLKGPLAELRRVKKEQFKLQADIKGYVLRKGDYKIPVYLVQDAPGNIRIIDTYLYVELKLDDLAEKSVPVLIDLNYTTAAGYKAISQPTANPNYVTVSGAAQYVNTVTHVKAKGETKAISSDYSQNLELRGYNQSNQEVGHINIIPGSVDVVMDIKKTKIVGVNVKTKNTYKEGISVIEPLQVTPSTIEIAGDEQVIKDITSVDTEDIDLSKITTSGAFDVKLVIPQNVTITSGKDTVNIKTSVDKISQKNFNLPIKFNNLGADYVMNLDKDKVSVVITGPATKLETLIADNIRCYVNLANLSEGEGHTVPVTVTVPEGFTLVSKNPQNVKVTITKKSSEQNADVPVSGSENNDTKPIAGTVDTSKTNE